MPTSGGRWNRKLRFWKFSLRFEKLQRRLVKQAICVDLAEILGSEILRILVILADFGVP